MDVTKKFVANRQEAKAEINKKIDIAKKENQSILDKEKNGQLLTSQEKDQLNSYNEKVDNYQKLGVLLDTISTGLSAPTSSGLGIAAATLSPAASYEIGQHFKGNGTEGSASHILAHTVLGAAVAAAGVNDALTAGLAAGGAEAVAPILSSYLYGGKKPSELTADEKSTISSIVGLAGSALGAMTGDVGSTIQGGNVAQNAVENNDFLVVSQGVDKKLAANKKKKELEDKIAAECKNKSCIIPIAEKELGDKAAEFINNMTVRQLAAVLGADYDPLTGERITPNERLEAKASMLGLGFTKTVSGVAKLTDDALIVVEKKYGSEIAAKITNNFYRDDDLISRTAVREDGLKKAENISTATAPRNVAKGQVNQPRNIQEQMVWKDVLTNPKNGVELRNLNKDGRFPQDAGFVKMSKTIKTKEGKTIEIHYQYNTVTNKVYDMKLINKPLNMQ